MGGGGSKTQVTDYYLSVHLGVCQGPVDSVNSLIVGEKLAWSGNVTAAGITEVDIDNPGLFGGNKSEGGVSGAMHVLNGGKTQVLSEKLARKLGFMPSSAPAFRGMLSLWFCERSVSGRSGFLWASNNAYIKSAWVNVSRWAQLAKYLDYTPSVEVARNIKIGNDMNPAWIILEVLLNKSWGMGIPLSMLNLQSFLDAAKTLYDEEFGISILWSDQTDGETFIAKIINHINGAFYSNPFTGKIEMTLLRDDYTISDLPVLTADDCVVTSYQKKSYSETVNEMVVKYTSPDNEDLSSVVAHNLANINIQGGIVSQTTEYEGIRNATLALKVANRDLRILSTPLIGVELTVNGKAWKFKPGQVLVLNYPEYNINGVVMRIGNIDYGNATERKIKMTLTEDVFGAGVAHYTPQGALDTNDRTLPSKIDDVMLFSTPYGVLARSIGTSAAALVTHPTCPFVMLMSEGDNISSAETLQKQTPTSAELSVGDTLPQGKFTLVDPIGFDTTTTITLGSAVGYNTPSVGDLMVISNTAPCDVSDLYIDGVTGSHAPEIVYVTSVAGDGSYTVLRGCFDTVPFAWPAGSAVRLMGSSYSVIAAGQYGVDGVTSSYRLYPRNFNGQTRDSDTYTVVGDDRLYSPYRPANVRVNGTLYPTSSSLPLVLTWSGRNRLVETAEPMVFDASSVAEENGTLYNLAVKFKIGATVTTLSTIQTASRTATITAEMFDSAIVGVTELSGKTHSDITEVAITLTASCSCYDSVIPYQWRFDIA